MSEPFIGEIQLFGFDFSPRGWAFANGATLAIQQNVALFSLLGTSYGGNGKTTFQLPNFPNRAACNQGQGPGISPRAIGEVFGNNNITLSQNEMPRHSHSFTIYNQPDQSKKASSPSPGNSLALLTQSTPMSSTLQQNAAFASTMIGVAGNSQPHENRQPFLAINFCIALQGVFPAFQ